MTSYNQYQYGGYCPDLTGDIIQPNVGPKTVYKLVKRKRMRFLVSSPFEMPRTKDKMLCENVEKKYLIPVAAC